MLERVILPATGRAILLRRPSSQAAGVGDAEDKGASYGSASGGAIGGAVGAAYGNPALGAAVGKYVGGIIGGKIGSVFNKVDCSTFTTAFEDRPLTALEVSVLPASVQAAVNQESAKFATWWSQHNVLGALDPFDACFSNLGSVTEALRVSQMRATIAGVKAHQRSARTSSAGPIVVVGGLLAAGLAAWKLGWLR